MKKHAKINYMKKISLLFSGFGLVAVLISIIFNLVLFAFIGLGLTFWGIIIFYIRPEAYSKKIILDSTIIPLVKILDQTIEEFGYKGKPIYLPPKYFGTIGMIKVFIPKQEKLFVPTPEQIQVTNYPLVLQKPIGILITPPGQELCALFENRLKVSFLQIELNQITSVLPKVLIDDLELVDGLEIVVTNISDVTLKNKSVSRAQSKMIVNVKLRNSLFYEISKETAKLTNIHEKIGCPLCSAIACMITKVTGRTVVIEKTELHDDGKTVDMNYIINEN